MPGYDQEPRYSPDGRWIAFSSMARHGFEVISRIQCFRGRLALITIAHSVAANRFLSIGCPWNIIINVAFAPFRITREFTTTERRIIVEDHWRFNEFGLVEQILQLRLSPCAFSRSRIPKLR